MSGGSFAGRVALVTGGSQGLGHAVAARLRDEGATGLVIVGRDEAKGAAAAAELGREDCRVVFVAADIGTVDGCERIIARLDEEFGTCHAFVNCAAKTDRGSVWTSTPDLWDDMLAVNVRGPGLLCQGVARIMARENVAGSMVLVGSVAAHGSSPRLLPYATSKSALQGMVRNLAFQLMWHRIRVNQINPGWMDTPAEDLIQRQYEGATDGWLERAEDEAPFGKLIKPDEIARTIVHLATDESGMMTGASIDWDQTVLGAGSSVRPDRSLGDLP